MTVFADGKLVDERLRVTDNNLAPVHFLVYSSWAPSRPNDLINVKMQNERAMNKKYKARGIRVDETDIVFRLAIAPRPHLLGFAIQLHNIKVM